MELLKTNSNISKVYAIYDDSFSQVIAIAHYRTQGNRENLQLLKMERNVLMERMHEELSYFTVKDQLCNFKWKISNFLFH